MRGFGCARAHQALPSDSDSVPARNTPRTSHTERAVPTARCGRPGTDRLVTWSARACATPDTQTVTEGSVAPPVRARHRLSDNIVRATDPGETPFRRRPAPRAAGDDRSIRST